MWYGFIRIVFCALIFIGLLRLIRKLDLNHKKGLTIVALILLAIFCSLLSLVPIENLFITFGSPQSVFCYANTGTLLDVVDGDNSCMIICRTSGNALVLSSIPKQQTDIK